MRLQIALHGVPHVIEIDANPLAARKFESRHHVAVSGHNDNDLCQSTQGEPRYIEADAQIDALLLYVRYKILRLKNARPLLDNVSKCRISKSPSVYRRLSRTERKIRLHLQLLLQSQIGGKVWICSQIDGRAVHRIGQNAGGWRCVVVVDPKKRIVGQGRVRLDPVYFGLDFIDGWKMLVALLELDPDESTIDKDGKVGFHSRPTKEMTPPTRSAFTLSIKDE